jgi:hypothetical protein
VRATRVVQAALRRASTITISLAPDRWSPDRWRVVSASPRRCWRRGKSRGGSSATAAEPEAVTPAEPRALLGSISTRQPDAAWQLRARPLWETEFSTESSREKATLPASAEWPGGAA